MRLVEAAMAVRALVGKGVRFPTGSQGMNMKYEKIVSALSNAPNGEDDPIRLWHVSESEIEQAEHRIGEALPESLKDVWRFIGYGAFRGSLGGGNRINRVNALISPDQVAQAIEDAYEPLDGMPCFDVSDGDYLLLKPNGSIEHPAYPGFEISSDLREFVVDVVSAPDFWTVKLQTVEP